MSVIRGKLAHCPVEMLSLDADRLLMGRNCSKSEHEKLVRKAQLARIGEAAEGWLALTNGIVGDGRPLLGPWSRPNSRASSRSV